MLNEVKRMVILASSERILLVFESVVIKSFRSAFPREEVMGCYFHLTQSVMREVNEIGMKEDFENNDSLSLALHCLPAVDMLPPSVVTEVFFHTS